MVTGFLGSGKTTLVNRLLRHWRETYQSGGGGGVDGKGQIVAIVNDLAEFNVDANTIERESWSTGGCSNNAKKSLGSQGARVKTVRLQDGCVCCTVKDDFISGVEAVLEQQGQEGTAHLVVETSGVSDPAPVCQALRSPRLKGKLSLGCVVCMVDCSDESVLNRMEDSAAMRSQVREADLVLLNKCDLAPEGAVEDATARAEQLRSPRRTTALRCVRAGVSPSLILDGPGLEGKKGEGTPRGDRDRARAEAAALWSPAASSHDNDGVSSATLAVQGRLCLPRFHAFLLSLPRGVLRGKGLVRFCHPRGEGTGVPVHEFQLVGQRYECGAVELEEKEKESRVVLIGEGLNREELQDALRSCVCGEGGCGMEARPGRGKGEKGFRNAVGGDARFEVLEEPPWPGGVRFRLRCEYGSFGRLDGDLARAANRELACRLSGHWGLLCVTAEEEEGRGCWLDVDCGGMGGGGQGAWTNALQREAFVVLSNLIDPQAQAMYRGSD